MTKGEKVFVLVGFFIAIAGFIPFVNAITGTNISDSRDFLYHVIYGEIPYYLPFFTPAIIAGIALSKRHVGPIVGPIGIILSAAALLMLIVLYSITYGNTDPGMGIIFLPYAVLNIPFFVISLIALPIVLLRRKR